jgi:hypothetical protein
MHIVFLIRVLVMVTMMRGPPERPFLQRRRADHSQRELEHAARLSGRVPAVSGIRSIVARARATPFAPIRR